MASLEQRNHARSFLRKAEEYLASAEANLEAERNTVAAADAIHAGIGAKDAIVTELTSSTGKGKDHATAAKKLAKPSAGDPRPPVPRSGCASCSPARPTSNTASPC